MGVTYERYRYHLRITQESPTNHLRITQALCAASAVNTKEDKGFLVPDEGMAVQKCLEMFRGVQKGLEGSISLISHIGLIGPICFFQKERLFFAGTTEYLQNRQVTAGGRSCVLFWQKLFFKTRFSPVARKSVSPTRTQAVLREQLFACREEGGEMTDDR